MEENKNGSEPQTNGDDQTKVNTGSKNNVPIESEATATPVLNNDTPVVEVPEVKAEEKTSETSSVGNEAAATPASIEETDITKVSESVKVETDASVESVTSSSEELPIRAIPLTPQSTDDSIEQIYKDAVKLENPNLDVVFEEVDSAGRGGGPRFVPNLDPNRAIKTYLPKKGEFAILPIGRNSDKPSEGGIMNSANIEFLFKLRFFGATHKTQVTLVLVNGKELIGYILKSENKDKKGGRRGFYFPKHVAEPTITLPNKGKKLNLQVSKILVG